MSEHQETRERAENLAKALRPFEGCWSWGIDVRMEHILALESAARKYDPEPAFLMANGEKIPLTAEQAEDIEVARATINELRRD